MAAMVVSAGPVQRVVIGRSREADQDPVVVLARVMLFQAIEAARAGDLDERAWLLCSEMSEVCFEVCNINPLVARMALTAQWRQSNGRTHH